MADEFDQYARKPQTSDTDEFAQYARPAGGDFSGAYPTRADHKDEGFIAHATKTIRDLPDAFLSGRTVSGPLESLRDSMGSFVQNSTFHNGIRAIPGVAMAEDAIMQPYRTAQSGDVAGAWGDAADIGAQLLGLRAAGIRPAEPLRAVQVPGESAALPKMNPVARMLVNKIPVAGHMLTGAYDVAQERGMAIPGRTQSRIYGPPMDIRTSEPAPPPGWATRGVQASPLSAFQPPVEPIQGALPSGRLVGPAPAPRPGVIPLKRSEYLPGWAEAGVRNSAEILPEPLTPIRSALPSGRAVGGIQNQQSAPVVGPIAANPGSGTATGGPVVLGKTYRKASMSPNTGGTPGTSATVNANAEMMRQQRLNAPPATESAIDAPSPQGESADYSGTTSQYRPSRTKARFDAAGKRTGG